ncbi:hypothetical protein VTG60DRAFT_306 [Thermothelomyces hinnuleus]
MGPTIDRGSAHAQSRIRESQRRHHLHSRNQIQPRPLIQGGQCPHRCRRHPRRPAAKKKGRTGSWARKTCPTRRTLASPCREGLGDSVHASPRATPISLPQIDRPASGSLGWKRGKEFRFHKPLPRIQSKTWPTNWRTLFEQKHAVHDKPSS